MQYQARLRQPSTILCDRRKEVKAMRLTPPKQYTFWISVLLAVLAVLGKFANLPVVSGNEFWFLLIGYVVLAVGNLASGF
jgi:hypothetical protein